MAKYKVILNGEQSKETFKTKEDAEEFAAFMIGLAQMAIKMNKKKKPQDAKNDIKAEDIKYEIIEIEE